VVVTGGADGTVLMTRPGGAQRAPAVVGRLRAPVTALATAAAGGHLLVVAAGADRTAAVWDAALDCRRRRFGRFARPVHQIPLERVADRVALRPSGDGVLMVAFSAAEEVVVWAAGSHLAAMTLPAPVTALAFGADGTLVIGTARGVVAVTVPEPVGLGRAMTAGRGPTGEG
jgi:hypothetical protein